MNERHFGVDLSTWNVGVNYVAARQKGGVEFAILRAGFGKNSQGKDNQFDTHYAGCKAAGIPVGAYQYSYAQTVADARLEAKACVGWLKKKELSLPVFLDMEESAVKSLGKTLVTKIAVAWVKKMIAYGYTNVGIYSNPAWYTTVLDADKIRAAGGVLWVASWGTTKPAYEDMVLWQFGGETNLLRDRAVYGIGSVVDQDVWFGPLPSAELPEGTYVVVCNKKTTTLDRNGVAETGRYVAVGDVCTIKLVYGPLIEIVYPTSGGKRTAYLRNLANFDAV